MIEPETGVGLRDVIQVIARQWLAIGSCVMIVLAGVATRDLTTTKHYRASAQVEVTAAPGSTSANTQFAAANPDRAAQDAIVELESATLRSRVARDLGHPVAKVQGRQVAGTDVVTVAVTDRSASRAAAAANAYANALTASSGRRAASHQAAVQNQIKGRIASLGRTIDALTARIAVSRKQGRNAAADVSLLEAERLTAIQRRADLAGQLDDARIAGVSGSATILDRATPPSAPSDPRLVRDLLLALIGGLVLGIAIAFVRNELAPVGPVRRAMVPVWVAGPTAPDRELEQFLDEPPLRA